MKGTTVVEILEQILQTSAPKPRDLLKLDFYRQAMNLFQAEETSMRHNGLNESVLESHQTAHRDLFRYLKEFSGPWEEFHSILEKWQQDHDQLLGRVLGS